MAREPKEKAKRAQALEKEGRKPDEKPKATRTVSVGDVIVQEAQPSDVAMAVVEEARYVALHEPAGEMSRTEVIRSFGLVTRLSNAIDRRKSELRKQVDKIVAEDKPTAEDEEVRYEVPGFAIVATNGTYGDKIMNVERAIELVKAKNINEAHVMTIPPPPKAVFSEEKFRALVTLGKISEEELESVMDAADPKVSVSVKVDEGYDRAILDTVLGPDRVDQRKTLKS